MDPQVAEAFGDAAWLVERHGSDLDRLIASGDELGLHPHSWRWADDHWVSDQGDPGWVAHCAELSFETFERSLGSRCRAYRHGDRYWDDDLLRLIARRGVEVDLTIEPGMPATSGLAPDEATTGVIPATSAARQHVHRSGVVGAEDLLMVPLTSAPTMDRDRQEDLYDGVGYETLVLWGPPRRFAAALEAHLTSGSQVRHLAFAIRTDLAHHDTWWQAHVERNLEHLSAVLGPRLEWVTPSEARARLADEALSQPAEEPDGGSRLPIYARAVERALADSEAEVSALRVESEAANAAFEERLRITAGTAQELAARVEATELALADVRGQLESMQRTATWRAHQRLLPLLKAVVAARGAIRKVAKWRRGSSSQTVSRSSESAKGSPFHAS